MRKAGFLHRFGRDVLGSAGDRQAAIRFPLLKPRQPVATSRRQATVCFGHPCRTPRHFFWEVLRSVAKHPAVVLLILRVIEARVTKKL